MSQQILRNEDFKTAFGVHQIQNLLLRGEGSPLLKNLTCTPGGIYLDMLSGSLWLKVTGATDWKPFHSQLVNSIVIEPSVQEGDFVGIYGAGSWSASGNLTAQRHEFSGTGSQNAAMCCNGSLGAPIHSTTDLFNGTIWTASGNTTISKRRHGVFGAYNSGVSMGGFSTANFSTTELFNGATWVNPPANLNAAKSENVGIGSQNAGLSVCGFAAACLSSVEYFNGVAWFAGANNMSISVSQYFGGAGSQNAALRFGGAGGGVFAAEVSSTEAYNGSVWLISGNLSASKTTLSGGGSQNAAFCVGGNTGITTNIGVSTTELFNGVSWSLSGSLSTTRETSATAGTQGAGITAAGDNGASILQSTETHAQSTYRRLNYANLTCASNMGIAINVSNTSLSATLCFGDVPNTRIPSRNFFGFNRYDQENTNVYLEASRSIVSITASGASSVYAIVPSNTDVCNGMLLEVTSNVNPANNGLFPIIGFSGGSQVTIKNPSGVTTGGSGFARLVSSNRLSGLVATSITKSGSVMTLNFASAGGLSATQFQRLVQVGGAIYIPYSATTGTSGSSLNYGTYVITGVGSLNVSFTAQNSIAATEASLPATNIEYFSQCFFKGTTGPGDWTYGFNNRTRLLTNAYTDAGTNFF